MYQTILSQYDGYCVGWEIGLRHLTETDSIHVEATWHTDKYEDFKEALINNKIPINMKEWYHVALIYQHTTSVVTLYVNGQPTGKKLTHGATFQSYEGSYPILGQNSNNQHPKFNGMFAFVSATTKPLPASGEKDDFSAQDELLQELSQARLQSIQDCPSATPEDDQIIFQIRDRAKELDPEFFELKRGYIHDGKWFDMSLPKQCYKIEGDPKDKSTWKRRILGEVKQLGPDGARDFKVEFRGATPRQMRGLKVITKRYAAEGKIINREKEKVNYDNTTLYEIDGCIVRPFTEKTKKSFVEALPSTAGEQPPEWFMSHWWGEDYNHTINCVEQFIKDFELPDDEDMRKAYGVNGGGITIDTPIWVCALANRQHNLANDITMDPSKSGFAKAMQIAKYRTLSILDENSVVFSRVWCTLELYLTLVLAKAENENSSENTKPKIDGMWATYTSHPHTYTNPKDSDDTEKRNAVGIISCGMTTSDRHTDVAAAREEHFPQERIIAALKIDVENADASEESDKIHILNYIVDPHTCNFNKAPAVNHPQYNELNLMVRGAFVSSIPALRQALAKSDKDWNQALKAMQKSVKTNVMSFDFSSGWENLTKDKAIELIRHLPRTIEGLEIRHGPRGIEFVQAIGEFVVATKNLERLDIQNAYEWCNNTNNAETDGILEST